MSLVGDERAQSVQVGAVLLFGVLIIAFSSYQAFAVPEQNSEVEFNHNQQVQTQMQDLRNAIVSVPGQPNRQAISIQLGTQYPSRSVATNPGPPSGLLYTDGTTNESQTLSVQNAEALTSETADYWTGTTIREYNTGAIAYKPEYNVYNRAPETVYEHSVVYNQFREGDITRSGQTLVDGRDITLVTLNGSLSRSESGSVTVDVQPKSQSSQTVRVTNATDTSNVRVSFLTRLSVSEWKALLDEEIDPGPDDTSEEKYVADVTGTDGPGSLNEVTIIFERGQTYRLKMAKAGVGTGVTDESEAYLTTVDSTKTSVAKGGSEEIELEVRDAYNNPVSDVSTNGSVVGSDTGSLATNTELSDSDGRVGFVYETDQSTATGTHTVQFSFDEINDSFDSETPKDVDVQVTVTNPNRGPKSRNLVYNEDASAESRDGGVNSGVEFTVTNNVGEQVEILTVAIDPVNEEINGLRDTVAGKDSESEENELYIDADNDGYNDFNDGTELPETIDVESADQGSDPVLNDASDATFYLYDFREDFQSSADRVDMDGESVTITVTYERSSGGTDSKMFTVTPGGADTNEQPNADFTITSNGPEQNGKWDFDASPSSDPRGDIDTYEWDLNGDGIFDDATGQTVQDRKVDSSTIVSLRVVDDSGNADTIRKEVP